jgi:UTP--glucose-1-phosphate uridylyltransferase
MLPDAVIPVAGLGTRLLPATRSAPKEMLPVVDRPVVQYVVEELERAGVRRVLFVTGRRKRAIEDHFDVDPELERALGPTRTPGEGLELLYTRQPHPRGLGDALRYAEGFAGPGGVVVALGDAIIEPGTPGTPGIVTRLIDAYRTPGASAAIAVAEVPADAVSRFGIVVPGGSSDAGNPVDVINVVDVVEKPDPEQIISRGRAAVRPASGASARARALWCAPPWCASRASSPRRRRPPPCNGARRSRAASVSAARARS